MLTPRFKLTQDENCVFVTIYAPYTNVADTEVEVDDENFIFVSSPYFLRLRLPGKLCEEHGKGSYTCSSGEFNLTFRKVTPGELFENLDMITSLLAPRDIPDVNPCLVEALEEDGITIQENNDNVASMGLINSYPFGFANRNFSEFHNVGIEFPQVFELRVPENVPPDERHELRIKHENRKFSSDHYFADLFDTELIKPYLEAKMLWDVPGFVKDAEFTHDEISILKELPNKNYLISQVEYKQVLLSLVDILFGFCYDKRATLNDSTIESGWTINKLSATLSWFCTFDDMQQVLIACYRRALVYPIFRNFELCHKVKGDVVSLIKTGKRVVVKSLIHIHQMFNGSNDARYILNQLYIKDYLIFIQKCRNEELEELVNNVANIELTKADLGLELDELEYAAELVKEETETGVLENEMALKMASMSLLPGVDVNYEIDYDEDDDSSDSSSDSTSSSDDDSSSEMDSDDEAS